MTFRNPRVHASVHVFRFPLIFKSNLSSWTWQPTQNGEQGASGSSYLLLPDKTSHIKRFTWSRKYSDHSKNQIIKILWSFSVAADEVTTATSHQSKGSHARADKVSGHKCPAGSNLEDAHGCQQWEVSPSLIKKSAASAKNSTAVTGTPCFFKRHLKGVNPRSLPCRNLWE